MKRISIFCGSSSGFDTTFKTQALLLGEILAKQKIESVCYKLLDYAHNILKQKVDN